jgi:hypothetical protein
MADLSFFDEQLNSIVVEYEGAKAKSRYDDCSDILTEQAVRAIQSRCLAAINRVAGKNSSYYETADRVLKETNHVYGHLAGLVGVVQSLLADLRNGYMKSLEELIHSDVFADFLEMADHLTGSGYKDAAAVIAGSTLEAHLRNLCARLGLNIVSPTGPPVKADTMNAEIVKAGGYFHVFTDSHTRQISPGHLAALKRKFGITRKDILGLS